MTDPTFSDIGVLVTSSAWTDVSTASAVRAGQTIHSVIAMSTIAPAPSSQSSIRLLPSTNVLVALLSAHSPLDGKAYAAECFINQRMVDRVPLAVLAAVVGFGLGWVSAWITE